MKPLSRALAALFVLLFSISPVSYAATCNGEVVIKIVPGIPNPANTSWPHFGGHIYARTHLSSTACDWYTTRNAWTDTYEVFPSGVTSDAYNASTHSADWRGRPIDLVSKATVMQSAFGGEMSILRRNSGVASANVYVGDILWFDKLGADATEITQIPVELCYDFSSMWDENTPGNGSSASTLLQSSRFNYNGYASEDTLDLDTSIHHVENGVRIWKKCNTGYFVMSGPGAGYTLRLSPALVGLRNNEYHEGTNTYMVTFEGRLSSSFKITSLPDGVTCASASGVFPGCERPLNDNETGADAKQEKEPDVPSCTAQSASSDAEKSQGNSINIALGFKTQRETDYTGGDLSFTRIYRSDADWFSHSVGQNWRHNFDRQLTFYTSANSTTVDVTTGRGTVEIFRKSINGTWKAVDLDMTSRFEETADGYIYTRSGTSGVQEYFDADGKLTRIVPRAGHTLDLAYDTSDRLASVTDEQGQSLSFSYDGQDRISTLTTPDGTYSYSYDGTGNLAGVTNPDHTTRQYHYEDTSFPHALTGMTDENGVRYASWSYDDQGRAISSAHADGIDNYTIAYNPDETTTVTNPLGKQTTYTFQTIQGVRKIMGVEGHQSANCAAGFKDYSYTPQGWLESRTDWEGNVTRYAYDENGLVTSITQDAGGPGEECNPSSAPPWIS